MKTKTKAVPETNGVNPVLRTGEELRRVPLAEIDPSPFQPRKNLKGADWEDFVQSIVTNGVIQPGVGREANGRIELVCGHRRHAGAGAAGLQEMPLIIRPLTDEQATEIIAIENLQRAGLDPMEEAQGYEDWICRLTNAPTENGLTQFETRKDAIAYIEQRIGRKRATIYERLRLIDLNADEAAMLSQGQISASLASLMPTIPDAKNREAFRKYVFEQYEFGNTVTVREAQEMIEDDYCKPLREAPFNLKTEYSTKFGPLVSCEECPHRTGNMLEQFPELKSRPNVCTKPSCFRDKVRIVTELKLQDAAQDGQATLTAKDYAKRKAEFVSGDQWLYAKNRSGSWTDLMGQHKPKPVLVATADGLTTVYAKAEAAAAAEKNGVKFAAERKALSPAEQEAEDKKRAEAKGRREKLVREQTPQVLAYIRKLSEKQAWQLVLEELAHEDGPGTTAREKVLGYIFSRRSPIYYSGDWDPAALDFWKRAGVDFKAAEHQVINAGQIATRELFKLAAKKGCKTITEKFAAITAAATAAKVKDLDQCKTPEDYAALRAAFKGGKTKVGNKEGRKAGKGKAKK